MEKEKCNNCVDDLLDFNVERNVKINCLNMFFRFNRFRGQEESEGQVVRTVGLRDPYIGTNPLFISFFDGCIDKIFNFFVINYSQRR